MQYIGLRRSDGEPNLCYFFQKMYRKSVRFEFPSYFYEFVARFHLAFGRLLPWAWTCFQSEREHRRSWLCFLVLCVGMCLQVFSKE